MAYIFLAACIVMAASTVSARSTGSTCEMTSVAIQKDLMICVSHDPLLMIQMMQHINNISSLGSSDFICRNQKDIVDVVVCMMDKLAACVPGQNGNLVSEALPSRQRWADGIQFMCDHRSELIENKCMEPSMQNFIQCYVSKLQGLQNALGAINKDTIKSAVCSVVRLEESCIKLNHGSCSQKIVDLAFQMLEKFYPLDLCPAATVDLQNEVNNPFNNMLVHGMPLRFKPQGEVNYNIVQN
ncbi:unnamed protein product [Lymnaea stagnalis]|uniref:Secreted protein n=1 Tax=Lymnaea stagnalis TaxID=6523 RepID=A0AAV2HV53_LYMST